MGKCESLYANDIKDDIGSGACCVCRSVFSSHENAAGYVDVDANQAVFTGSRYFAGEFEAEDAQRAGFHSILNPPEIGEEVVCFGEHDYQRRGVVVSKNSTISDGTNGLSKGAEGVQVVVKDNKGIFSTWSAFLAPVNDQEYSSVCTEAVFQDSNFCKFIGDSNNYVSKLAAKESLEEWLEHLVDADGNQLHVSMAVRRQLSQTFDEKVDASLHLYSTHASLGPRHALQLGRDYSVYYRALNNTLNHDLEMSLRTVMPLIRRMIYLLLFDDSTAQRRLHPGGQVWKGDSQYPVPLNMQKLRTAMEQQTSIFIRQFTSTTSDHKLASKYVHREDGRGFLWTIDIPENFWGARDIQDVAWTTKESETLFPPYSEFAVRSVSDSGCHLEAKGIAHLVAAIPKDDGIEGGKLRGVTNYYLLS